MSTFMWYRSMINLNSRVDAADRDRSPRRGGSWLPGVLQLDPIDSDPPTVPMLKCLQDQCHFTGAQDAAAPGAAPSGRHLSIGASQRLTMTLEAFLYESQICVTL